MKKILPVPRLLFVGLLLMFIPVSCFKDKVTYTYTIQVPIYNTLSQVRANMKTSPQVSIENAGRIYKLGDWVFLNEVNKGIHLIDNRDPGNPVNAGFIPIPGNQDMAIQGSTLYADAYGDLVSFDIRDPLHATVKKILSNVFQSRNIYYFTSTGNTSTDPDSLLIPVAYSTKDTTVDYNTYQRYMGCSGFSGCRYPIYPGMPAYYSAAVSGGDKGQGGSMAKFTIVNKYLYALSNPDLNSFDISDENNPAFADKVTVDWSAETLFPLGSRLFVGAGNGMYMYDIQATPAAPKAAGQFTHARTCDPVVADDHYAYVTLSSGTVCQGFDNELDIIDINDISHAALVKKYPLDHPKGLAKDGNLLFICDDSAGLKLFDASDVNNLKLLAQLTDARPIDIIASHGIAIVLTPAGIYEYDYSNPSHVYLRGYILTLKV